MALPDRKEWHPISFIWNPSLSGPMVAAAERKIFRIWVEVTCNNLPDFE
jgi:hypothetical protein